MRELQAIIEALAAAPFEVAALILAVGVIALVAWALVKLVQQTGKQTDAMSRQADAMIETQKLHNETERRRNDERRADAERLDQVVKLSDEQQKKIDTLEDEIASARTAAGGAINEAERANKASDQLRSDLKITKEAFDLLQAEYKRYQEQIDLKLAEANLKITTLENQHELDAKTIKDLKIELEKTRKENLTALTTIQHANTQNANAAQAWTERFQLQDREITGLQERVKQLETDRNEARKERDEKTLRVATLHDENLTLKQQLTEMSKRVHEIEVKTAPLSLPEGDKPNETPKSKAA